MSEARVPELSQNDRVRAEESMDNEDIEGKSNTALVIKFNFVLHL